MTAPPATILIVDDDLSNRKLLEMLLRPEGHRTRTAASGEEALASVARDPPDLILLDVMMPGMDGHQVAGILKADAATAHIPVIMLTARVDRSARLAGLQAGAEEFLTKPFDRSELWLRVRNLLRIKAMGDTLKEQSLRLEQQVLAVKRSEAKFRGMVNQSLIGIAFLSEGRFTYANDKFADIFGYSNEQMLALDAVGIAVPEDRARVAGSLRDLEGGDEERVDFVLRGQRREGTPLDIQIHGSGMRLEGRMLLIILALDITERTRAEREVLALQERLREQSTLDPLTGLYNRRYLDETLGRELILAARSGQQVSVIMGDLDHFKAINDRHGHGAGDEVLRAFGALMKQQARGSDIYCRYGGEEFLMVLPGMTEDSAVERMEQLRVAMANASLACDGAPLRVTASFGLANFPRHGRTGDELIAAADRALYAAKEAGRNRVIIAAPPDQGSRTPAAQVAQA